MTSDELTHLDLFSGVAGFSLAAQWAGFRTIGFSEIEPYACRVLAERFPGVPNVGDVRQRASFARFAGGVDVLTGGFPCQPWSVAGQQRGAGDDRHIWPAMCDVIEIVRPTWIICENVPGLISVGLEPVLADMESLGYATQPFVVPACAVGARHRRDRVWLVGYSPSARRECRPTERSIGTEKREPLLAARCETLADADEPRPQGRGGEKLRERAGKRAAGARGASVANTHGDNLREQQERELGSGGSTIAQPNGAASRRLPQSPVGRVPARLPARLDVGAPGEAQKDWEAPRVAAGVTERTHRLRGLGNSIVPQVAEQFFRFIAQIESGEVTP